MEEKKIVQYHAAIIGIGTTIADRMQLQARQRAIVLKAHELLAAQEVAVVSAVPPQSAEDRWTKVHTALIAEVFDKAVELLQTAKAHGVTHVGEGIFRESIEVRSSLLKKQKEETLGIPLDLHQHRDIKLPRGVAAFTLKNVLGETLGVRYAKEFKPLYRELHARVKLSVFHGGETKPN